MKKLLLTTVWVLFALITITSCSNDDIVKKQASEDDGFKVETKVYVNDQEVSGTKAATNAGYTTGDGLYHKGDPVVVAAYANSGYELVRFYAKDGDPLYQDGSSYSFKAKENKYFKAEFKASLYSVNCAITGQGTVQINGQPLLNGAKYPNGTYTLTAVPEAGWTQSWKTKQIVVDGADVNESITFTERKKYTITEETEFDGGGGKPSTTKTLYYEGDTCSMRFTNFGKWRIQHVSCSDNSANIQNVASGKTILLIVTKNATIYAGYVLK